MSEPIVVRDPEILGGEPFFAGTRVPAKSLTDYLAAGRSIDEFLADFPAVRREQIVRFFNEARERLAVRRVMSCAELLGRLRALRPWLAERGVDRISLFGSYARDEATAESDIDLVVELAPGSRPSLLDFAGLQLELEEKLGAPVDLFTRETLHPRLKDRIEAALVHV